MHFKEMGPNPFYNKYRYWGTETYENICQLKLIFGRRNVQIILRLYYLQQNVEKTFLVQYWSSQWFIKYIVFVLFCYLFLCRFWIWGGMRFPGWRTIHSFRYTEQWFNGRSQVQVRYIQPSSTPSPWESTRRSVFYGIDPLERKKRRILGYFQTLYTISIR